MFRLDWVGSSETQDPLLQQNPLPAQPSHVRARRSVYVGASWSIKSELAGRYMSELAGRYMSELVGRYMSELADLYMSELAGRYMSELAG